MAPNKYINLTRVLNTVDERLEDDSLIHTFSSKTKTLESTKLFNAKLSRSAKSKRNYQQVLKWKNEALEEAIENVEVTDDSEFSDSDLKKCHDKTNQSLNETRVPKNKRVTRVAKKSGKEKASQSEVQWANWFPRHESKTDQDAEPQNEENIENLVAGSTKTEKRKIAWETDFEQTFVHRRFDLSTRVQCTPSKVTIDLNNSEGEDSLSIESTTKESIRCITSKVVKKKCPKNVRRNLTSHLNDADAEVSSSFEDDIHNDFVPSDFKAQSTQILSDTLLTGGNEEKKKSIRRTRNEGLNQPRDSGIEEDSKDDNLKYHNGIKPVDENRVKNKTNLDKCAKVTLNRIPNDVATPASIDSMIKSNDQKNSQSSHEKCSVKIIKDQKVTKKYKIVSTKQIPTEIQGVVQNNPVTDTHPADKIHNGHVPENEEQLDSIDSKVGVEADSNDCKCSDADPEKKESYLVPEIPSLKSSKSMKSRVGKPQYVSRQKKKLRELRLIAESDNSLNHSGDDGGDDGIENQKPSSSMKKLPSKKKVFLRESSNDSSSDDDGSQCINNTSTSKTSSASGKRTCNSEKSDLHGDENDNSSPEIASSSSEPASTNDLNEKNKNVQNDQNHKNCGMTRTDEEKSNSLHEKNEISNEPNVTKLRKSNDGKTEIVEQDSDNNVSELQKEPPCRESSLDSQRSAKLSSSIVLSKHRKISDIKSVPRTDEDLHQLRDGTKNIYNDFKNISSHLKMRSQINVPLQEEFGEVKSNANSQQNNLHVQNYPDHQSTEFKDDEDEEDNISPVVVKKLSQLKKMDFLGDDSDSDADSEISSKKNNASQVDPVIGKIEESDGVILEKPQMSAPDSDDESIQSSPLKYESSSESSRDGDDVDGTAPDIEDHNETQEEDEYVDAEEDAEISFQSFSSTEEKVDQSSMLITQKSPSDDRMDKNGENAKFRPVHPSMDIESHKNNSSDVRLNNNSNDPHISCNEGSPLADDSDESQDKTNGADELPKKIDEPTEVDENEMGSSAFKKLSQFKKMNFFNCVSDSSSDEKVETGTNSTIEVPNEETKTKMKKKKKKKMRSKGSEMSNESRLSDAVKDETLDEDLCASRRTREPASSAATHENVGENNESSKTKKQDSDSESSEKEKILGNCLDAKSENEEDADEKKHQKVKKKHLKKSKKRSNDHEIQISLTEGEEAVDDEKPNSQKSGGKKNKKMAEINNMNQEQDLHESILKNKMKVIDEAQDVIVSSGKRVESQDMFSSEEEDLIDENIRSGRPEPTVVNSTRKDEDPIDEREHDDDHDEIKMSPSALKRLSQYKRLDLFDDNSDDSDSSADETPMKKNVISKNTKITEITAPKVLNKKAMKNSEDQKPKAKSQLISQSKTNRASIGKLSNGISHVASDNDDCSDDDCKNEVQTSCDPNNEDANENIPSSPDEKRKTGVLPEFNESKIEILNKSATSKETKTSFPTKCGLSTDNSESEDSENLELRPSTSCNRGEQMIENTESLEESTNAHDYENLGPVVIAETQESDTSSDESEVVYSSQAENPARKKIDSAEPQAGNSSDDLSKSVAEIALTPKVTKISDLVRKENLSLLHHESTTELDNLSDNDEIFILDVPKSVFIPDLKGKRIAFSKTTLTFGDENYEAFQRKTTPTFSCVLKTNGKNKFETQNIRPVVSIVARRKKIPLQGMNFEDSTEFQTEQIDNNAGDEKEKEPSKSETTKEKKSNKRKLSLSSANSSKWIEEDGCEQPSSKRKKLKSSASILDGDEEFDEYEDKAIQPESQAAEKSKKGKKSKVILTEDEFLVDSKHSNTSSRHDSKIDTIEKKITKIRSDSKSTKTKKVEALGSLTDGEEKKDRELKARGASDEDVYNGHSNVTVRKKTKVKNEKKAIRSKISSKNEEIEDESETKIAKPSPLQEDSDIDAKKCKKIKISDGEWEVTENAKTLHKKSKSKSSKVLRPIDEFECADEKLETSDEKHKIKKTAEAKSEKENIYTSSGVDADEDVIPCSIESKKKKKNVLKAESQKEFHVEEIAPEIKDSEEVAPLFTQKLKSEGKPPKTDRESKAATKKRKTIDQQPVKEEKVTNKKPKLTDQNSKPKTSKKKEKFSMVKAAEELHAIIQKTFPSYQDSSCSSSNTTRYEPLQIERMKKHKASSSSDEGDKEFVNRSFRMRDKSKSENEEDSPKPSTSQADVEVNTDELKKKKKKHKKQGPIHFDE